jgi:hypothetical protein
MCVNRRATTVRTQKAPWGIVDPPPLVTKADACCIVHDSYNLRVSGGVEGGGRKAVNEERLYHSIITTLETTKTIVERAKRYSLGWNLGQPPNGY